MTKSVRGLLQNKHVEDVLQKGSQKLSVFAERYLKSKRTTKHHTIAPLWPKVCEGCSKISMLRTSSKMLSKLGVLAERYLNSLKKTHHAIAPLWPKVCEGCSKTGMLRTTSKKTLKTRWPNDVAPPPVSGWHVNTG